MSGFNTIKKSRKRSHEIDEKLNVLNRELEKTKDIQEQPAVNTSGLYTKVQQSLPQDPVQGDVPDPSATGPTTGNWTQPIGDGEDGGTAGDIPTSFPKIWNNPGYQDAGAGFYGANGRPLFSEDDLPYDIPDPSETGGVAALGGMQRERLGMDPKVVTGYIRRDVNVDQFVDTDDGFIEHNGVAVTFKTHPELFVPVNYWVTFSFRNPHIDAYWPNNSLGLNPQYQGVVAGSEDSNPRAMLTAYKYVGGARTQTFDPVGSRGSTTAGDPKGTGDADQYPPLNWFERLGREAFEKLKELAKSAKEIVDDFVEGSKIFGSVPTSASNLAANLNENDPDHPDFRKHDPTDPNYKGPRDVNFNPIESAQTDKDLDNAINSVNGGKGPKDPNNLSNSEINEVSSNMNAKYKQNPTWYQTFHTLPTGTYPDGTPITKISKNKNGGWNVESNYRFTDDQDASDPFSNIAAAINPNLPSPRNAVVATAEKNKNNPEAEKFINKSTGEVVGGMFNSQIIYKGNKPMYTSPRTNINFSKKTVKENAYMALLDRTYKPSERDYIKYAIDTPEGRKKFDLDLMMVENFIKRNPDKYEYVMKRYPKDDPRLSMLNYRMDRMTEASDKYLETQFPTNQTLFTKVKERTRKSMNLTDPKNFKPVKDPIKYVDVKKTKKLKETVTRHFNKPVKSKSMFGLNMGKVRKTNQKMIEKREQEQRVKEEDKAYIEERMSRQKSNWKDDLTSL